MSRLIRPWQPILTRVRKVVNGRAWLTPNRKRNYRPEPEPAPEPEPQPQGNENQ